VGALAAVDLAADDPLGIRDGDTALAALHKNNEGDHRHHQDDDQGKLQDIHGPRGQAVDDALNARGKIDHDAGKDDERNAVADPPLRDLLAQPHDKHRSRGQGQEAQQLEPDAGVGDNGRARIDKDLLAGPDDLAARALQGLQEEGDAEGLDDADKQRAVACVLGDLLPAQLPLFG